jgi:DNA anti-recombination protein RmuC
MGSTAARLTSVAERLHGMDTRLAEADKQAAQRWADTAARMDQARAALNESSEGITQAVSNYVAQLNRALSDSTTQQHEQWGTSLDSIREALGALQGLANHLRDTSLVVADAVERLDKQGHPGGRS